MDEFPIWFKRKIDKNKRYLEKIKKWREEDDENTYEATDDIPITGSIGLHGNTREPKSKRAKE